MSTKQESVSGATFKAWPFSSIFNFGCKDDRTTAATCKYCQLVVSQSDEALCKFLPLPIVAKNSILNVAEFLDPPLKTSPRMKTSLVSCETSLFFLFRNVATFVESHVFLYCFLLSSLLDDCCHYLVFTDPVNGYSKSKQLVKEQVLLKGKITFGYVYLF